MQGSSPHFLCLLPWQAGFFTTKATCLSPCNLLSTYGIFRLSFTVTTSSNLMTVLVHMPYTVYKNRSNFLKMSYNFKGDVHLKF